MHSFGVPKRTRLDFIMPYLCVHPYSTILSSTTVLNLYNIQSNLISEYTWGPSKLLLTISSTVRPHLSAPQISSSLTFRSSFYWNKSAIILLYTIYTAAPSFIQFPHFIHNFIQNGCVRISEVSLHLHIDKYYGL